MGGDHRGDLHPPPQNRRTAVPDPQPLPSCQPSPFSARCATSCGRSPHRWLCHFSPNQGDQNIRALPKQTTSVFFRCFGGLAHLIYAQSFHLVPCFVRLEVKAAKMGISPFATMGVGKSIHSRRRLSDADTKTPATGLPRFKKKTRKPQWQEKVLCRSKNDLARPQLFHQRLIFFYCAWQLGLRNLPL